MSDDALAVRAGLVRALIEDCWADGEAGLDRMAELVRQLRLGAVPGVSG